MSETAERKHSAKVSNPLSKFLTSLYCTFVNQMHCDIFVYVLCWKSCFLWCCHCELLSHSYDQCRNSSCWPSQQANRQNNRVHL